MNLIIIVLAALVIFLIVCMCLSLSKLNSIDKNIEKIAKNSNMAVSQLKNKDTNK